MKQTLSLVFAILISSQALALDTYEVELAPAIYNYIHEDELRQMAMGTYQEVDMAAISFTIDTRQSRHCQVVRRNLMEFLTSSDVDKAILNRLCIPQGPDSPYNQVVILKTEKNKALIETLNYYFNDGQSDVSAQQAQREWKEDERRSKMDRFILNPLFGYLLGQSIKKARAHIQDNNGQLWNSPTLGSVFLFSTNPAQFIADGYNYLMGNDDIRKAETDISIRDAQLGDGAFNEHTPQIRIFELRFTWKFL